MRQPPLYIRGRGRDYLLLGLNSEVRVSVWKPRLFLGEFNRIGLDCTIFRNRKGHRRLEGWHVQPSAGADRCNLIDSRIDVQKAFRISHLNLVPFELEAAKFATDYLAT